MHVSAVNLEEQVAALTRELKHAREQQTATPVIAPHWLQSIGSE
jgi:hypothetical protein